MTHVMVVPADRGGCGYYRLIWPAQAVSLVRPDWTVSIVPPEKVQAGFLDDKFVGVQGFPDPLPDLLVMQRVGTPGQFEVLRWAHQQGIATVVDYDDAMWCIDKGNTAWRSWNLANRHRQHWRICDEATDHADLVTCTTDALAKRYGRRHHRAEVIWNYVPKAATEVPRLPRHDGGFVAGWSGFTRTHPGDCTVSAPAAKAVLESGGRLYVVADPEGAAREWGLRPDQVDGVGPQRLGPDYYASLTGMDLMLVGLRDTPFNTAKSSLKVLEAAAVGVPSVAPFNAAHKALARKGFPVRLAASPSEWADAAKQMQAGHERGHWPDISNEVREAALGYTIEGNAERWAVAWERAMERH